MARVALPTVTLCAAASVNVVPTLEALRVSLEQVEFAECLFFTDEAVVHADHRIRIVPIARLDSSRAYSEFLLKQLSDHIRTQHCLIVQWDGFVLDAGRWDPEFLRYDYIGAPWPQFHDGHDVGNGGFSLRSCKLLEACHDPRFRNEHPEDVAICRVNRDLLEREHGLRFADRSTAQRFAFERTEPRSAFGFHGLFNVIPALGAERFWAMYSSLDDRRTAFVDYGLLLRQLGSGRNPLRRRLRLTLDWLRQILGR